MHDERRADVRLHIDPREGDAAARELPDTEFRILVLGDFSAGGNRSLVDGRPVSVDRDTLDRVIARLGPVVRVALPDDADDLELAFSSMDDFHPDRLVDRLRGRKPPGPAPGAASSSGPESAGDAEVRERTAPPTPAAEAASVSSEPPRSAAATAHDLAGMSLLDEMVGAAHEPARRPGAPHAPPRDALSALVERAVAPSLVRQPDAAARAADAQRQTTTSRLLRAVLHDHQVQHLEASWRAVELLVRRLDTDGPLRLFLLDVTADRLPEAIERLARDRAPGDVAWALLTSVHAFGDGEGGAEVLARAAIAARPLGVSCVAAAPPSFAGVSAAPNVRDDERAPAPEVYGLIRRSLEGRHLGLTFPRVLLRAPYGRDNPCDAVDFEEIEDPARHDDYLWGSGAALVALLLGEAFLERGWSFGGRARLDVAGLPLVLYRRGPETIALPCAETLMSERAAGRLLDRGIMPVATIRDADRVRLVELRSVALPPAPLAGPWSPASA